MDSVRRSMSLILSQKDLDRKHFLYSRKGHKKIGIKNRMSRDNSRNPNELKEKAIQIDSRIQSIYSRYDCLVSYKISDKDLF
jgi:hypothetical protein